MYVTFTPGHLLAPGYYYPFNVGLYKIGSFADLLNPTTFLTSENVKRFPITQAFSHSPMERRESDADE